MRRIAAKLVPRLLTNDQKQRRLNVCLELREKANEDPTFICRITTGDESWISGYDPETNNNRRSGRAHNHQEQKSCCRSGVQQRACSLYFFEVKWIAQRELVHSNIMSTVNSDFYCEVFRHLRENVRQKSRNFGATTTGSFITTTRRPT
jgi:hypothetical protein